MSVDTGLFLQGQLGTSGNNTHWAYPGAVPKDVDRGNFFGPVSSYLRLGDRIFLPRAELTVVEKVQNAVRVAFMKALAKAEGATASSASAPSRPRPGTRKQEGT